MVLPITIVQNPTTSPQTISSHSVTIHNEESPALVDVVITLTQVPAANVSTLLGYHATAIGQELGSL